MFIDYRTMEIGTKEHSGIVQICPVCKQRGLMTKGDTRTFVTHYISLSESGKDEHGNFVETGELTHSQTSPQRANNDRDCDAIVGLNENHFIVGMLEMVAQFF
jgi:predicted kinase